jgi:hypothetical protein
MPRLSILDTASHTQATAVLPACPCAALQSRPRASSSPRPQMDPRARYHQCLINPNKTLAGVIMTENIPDKMLSKGFIKKTCRL